MIRAITFGAVAFIVAQPCSAGDRGSVSEQVPAARPVPLDTHPIPDEFDLSRVSDGANWDGDEAPTKLDPDAPRGMETRDIVWNPPSFEMAIVDGGPVLAVGAMGTKRKGTPKLAHVAIDWTF